MVLTLHFCIFDRSFHHDLDSLKLTHADVRVNALCDIVMPDILPRLYSLADAVNGMVETSELTFEYALKQTFMKDNGTIS